MYTAYIGKRLIECLNRRDGTNYTAEAFFCQVYFPLFFGQERYLQNVNNSPVDQAYKNKKTTPLTREVLRGCLEKIREKAQSGTADASMFLGGAATNTTDTTSCQVTNLARAVSAEDVYASWIGAAVGVGIEGGLSLLIDADEVLIALYEGWARYRAMMDQTPVLKPMQINTWNGRWLTWRLGKDWYPERSLFEPKLDGAKQIAAYETQTWVQLLFALSYFYREEERRQLTVYVYAFRQMNRTLGFVRLQLPQVRRLHSMYERLFTVPEGMPAAAFEELYNTEFGFQKACQFVEIGLRAIEPKGLTPFLKGELPRPARATPPEKQLQLQIYQTWIIAMLNNEKLIKQTEEVAAALHRIAQSAERGKMGNRRSVEDVLVAKDRRRFIEALAKVAEVDGENAALWNRVVNETVMMPVASVPLFLTLLRFKFVVASQT